MTSAFCWQNSVSICSGSFCTPKAKLACFSRYLLASYFCIPVPYDEKDIFFFFWCQFQKVLQGFRELFNFLFFGISGWGIELNYCDIELLALEINRDHSVIFELVPKYCILDSSVAYECYSISSKGFLPTVVDIMFI